MRYAPPEKEKDPFEELLKEQEKAQEEYEYLNEEDPYPHPESY